MASSRHRAGRPVVYLAWSSNPGRVAELGEALGAVPLRLYPRALSRTALLPLRYLVSALITLVRLAALRPRTVLVVNPPVPAAAVVALHGRLTGTPYLLDSHPGGFGAQGDRLSALLQPLHRWAVRRARAVLTTGEPWSSRVRAWGSTPLVVHEPPAPWHDAAFAARADAPPSARPRIAFLGTYGRDEPVAELLAAAERLPDVDVRVTGNPAAAPPGLLERLPATVTPVGYLAPPQYQAEVREADVVVVLTTEPTSVMRAAYEAVYAGRPLVVSDWPVLREVFPHAVHVPGTVEGIAAGVREALDRHAELRAAAPAARDLQQQRWAAQLAALQAAVD